MKMIDDGLATRTIAGWSDGWRPIGTAPKDGSRFLAYIGNGTITGAQYITPNAFSADNLGSGNTEPVYWMPLPKPPKNP